MADNNQETKKKVTKVTNFEDPNNHAFDVIENR